MPAIKGAVDRNSIIPSADEQHEGACEMLNVLNEHMGALAIPSASSALLYGHKHCQCFPACNGCDATAYPMLWAGRLGRSAMARKKAASAAVKLRLSGRLRAQDAVCVHVGHEEPCGGAICWAKAPAPH